MFDFIVDHFSVIFATVIFLIGALYLAAEIQTFQQQRQRQQRRSESARRGWVTRRARTQ